MIKFESRNTINKEFTHWCMNQIPPCHQNVNTFLTFLSMHMLVDDEIINIWCENRERDEE